MDQPPTPATQQSRSVTGYTSHLFGFTLRAGEMQGLLATAEFCEQVLGRELYGRVTRSGLNPLLKTR